MFDLFDRPFYFPRRVGRPVRRPVDPGGDETKAKYQSYETWREGLSRAGVAYEPVPEAALRRQLLVEPARGGGVTLVTGEPGAGKSFLLEDLVAEWARGGPFPRLGALVPVRVRCRDLTEGDLARCENDELADRLWARRAARPAGIAEEARGFLDRGDGRVWEPLWLIDGLDELPGAVLDEDLCRRLATLPGRVCMTCRTAVAQARRDAFRGAVAPEGHLELLPLDGPEQREFLAACFDGDGPRADALHRSVESNPQLRELAGSPLLLGLVAETGEAALPATRAEFYRDAIAELWRRRVEHPEREDPLGQRDDVLTALAGGFGLGTLVGRDSVLTDCLRKLDPPAPNPAGLRSALRASGLLQIRRERVEFLHLTFQEFYLALHLEDRPFANLLEEHWTDPRFEEVLALRLAMAIAAEAPAGAAEEADAVLTAFVQRHLAAHRQDPVRLHALGRSPLRLALHLVARSGTPLDVVPNIEALLRKLLCRRRQLTSKPIALFRRLGLPCRPSLLEETRLAVAADRRSPAALHLELADDPVTLIREELARNPTAPPEALHRLSKDPEEGVCVRLARNSSAPLEAFQRLAISPQTEVRGAVSSAPWTPVEMLEQLAEDPERGIRRSLATNPSAPAALLQRLGEDARAGIAANPSAPRELLCSIAQDGDPYVRRHVAANSSAPAEILRTLAQDASREVRRSLAENPSAPVELLQTLETDAEGKVREALAGNPSIPPDVLWRLADDPHEDVPSSVGRNRAAPPELLEYLARSTDEFVRGALAWNPMTPSSVLEGFAEDNNTSVLGGVAVHPATSPELLSRLADHEDSAIRGQVAGNPSAPPAVLKRLVVDQEAHVRAAAARNPRTLLEDLVL